MNLSRKKALALAAMLAALAAPACSKRHSGAASSSGTTVAPGGVSGSVVPSQTPRASRAAKPVVPVVTVTVDASGFRPRDVRMAPGTNVIWRQADGGPHVVVSGGPGHEDGKFRSLSMTKGSSFTIVARNPGTYRYFDRLHPSLTAQFVVSGGSPSGSGGTSP
jgi:plastocyanin